MKSPRTSLPPPVLPGEGARSSSGGRGDGVYAYDTSAGVRYRFVFRQHDGTLSTRRGFTSRHAAVTARRRAGSRASARR